MPLVDPTLLNQHRSQLPIGWQHDALPAAANIEFSIRHGQPGAVGLVLSMLAPRALQPRDPRANPMEIGMSEPSDRPVIFRSDAHGTRARQQAFLAYPSRPRNAGIGLGKSPHWRQLANSA